jgi:hypothetical protein
MATPNLKMARSASFSEAIQAPEGGHACSGASDPITGQPGPYRLAYPASPVRVRARELL